MVYAYLQIAQEDAAERWVDTAAEIFSCFNPAAAKRGRPSVGGVFGMRRHPGTLLPGTHDCTCATRMAPVPSKFHYADAITYFARGPAAAHPDDKVNAEVAIGGTRMPWRAIGYLRKESGGYSWVPAASTQNLVATR